MNLNQVTLPATNLAQSIAFYQKLGCTLLVESPHYARFKSSLGDATLSVHSHLAHPAVVFLECGALDVRVAELQALGLVFTQMPQDEPWGWREARLQDPGGNTICLYSAGEFRLNPPWRVGGRQPMGLVTPTLDTPRLLLRPVQPADLDDFLAINCDPDVTRFLPYPVWTGRHDAVAWYHRMFGYMAQGQLAYTAVQEKSSRLVVGGALLRSADGDAGRLEVGYLLGRAHWGKGLMREAILALVSHAFSLPDVRRVEAHIDARNTASQRLVDGLGFAREAVLRDQFFDNGEVSDAMVYGVLRREWPSAAAAWRPHS